MDAYQWVVLGIAVLIILSTVCAALLLSIYGVMAFYAALELYYGRVQALEKQLERSQLQEQRGAENYEALGQMYDRLTDKHLEAQRTMNQQAELIRNLRNQDGQSLVEYAVIVVLLVIVVAVAVPPIGQWVAQWVWILAGKFNQV